MPPSIPSGTSHPSRAEAVLERVVDLEQLETSLLLAMHKLNISQCFHLLQRREICPGRYRLRENISDMHLVQISLGDYPPIRRDYVI